MYARDRNGEKGEFDYYLITWVNMTQCPGAPFFSSSIFPSFENVRLLNVERRQVKGTDITTFVQICCPKGVCMLCRVK